MYCLTFQAAGQDEFVLIVEWNLVTEQDIKNIKHLVLMLYSVLPLGAFVLRSYHSSGTNV